jgi:hypothetical protein
MPSLSLSRALALPLLTHCRRGEADERTGLEAAVEPWCDQLWRALFPERAAAAPLAVASPVAVQTAVPARAPAPAPPPPTAEDPLYGRSPSVAPDRQNSTHAKPPSGSGGSSSDGDRGARRGPMHWGLPVAAVGIAMVLLLVLARRR